MTGREVRLRFWVLLAVILLVGSGCTSVPDWFPATQTSESVDRPEVDQQITPATTISKGDGTEMQRYTESTVSYQNPEDMWKRYYETYAKWADAVAASTPAPIVPSDTSAAPALTVPPPPPPPAIIPSKSTERNRSGMAPSAGEKLKNYVEGVSAGTGGLIWFYVAGAVLVVAGAVFAAILKQYVTGGMLILAGLGVGATVYGWESHPWLLALPIVAVVGAVAYMLWQNGSLNTVMTQVVASAQKVRNAVKDGVLKLADGTSAERAVDTLMASEQDTKTEAAVDAVKKSHNL